MTSRSGRYVIAYNGEIYNWKSIRESLKKSGSEFHTGTDTEVLLEAVSQWGIEKTLQACVGMFAFCLWDREKRIMVLARDRMGEKPLYFGRFRGAWWAASELKALQAIPDHGLTIDSTSIALYLRRQYVPAPRSIYSEIQKLNPACYAILHSDGEARIQSYWSFDDLAAKARSIAPRSCDEAAEELESLLVESVCLQRMADVPVGAFLSGGIDSSTVVALLQAQGGPAIKTFSIGFREAEFDESAYARDVARHLQTDHHEMIVEASQAYDVIPEVSRYYDEPYADSSAIPTILVSRLAREQVTVSLSGDGGDELFAGYDRYRILHEAVRRKQGRRFVDRLAGAAFAAGEAAFRFIGNDELAYKFSWRKRQRWIDDPRQLYYEQLTQFGSTDALLNEDIQIDDQLKMYVGLEPVRHAMAADAQEYLPDDILVKVDRASMSCSLESRIPLLDHRIVEFAWRLPLSCCFSERASKAVLKSVLYRHVPAKLFARPKKGFGVPVSEWVKGPIRDWAESLLSEDALVRGRVLNVNKVRKLWERHRSGRIDDGNRVWSLLMLQDWLLNSGR